MIRAGASAGEAGPLPPPAAATSHRALFPGLLTAALGTAQAQTLALALDSSLHSASQSIPPRGLDLQNLSLPISVTTPAPATIAPLGDAGGPWPAPFGSLGDEQRPPGSPPDTATQRLSRYLEGTRILSLAYTDLCLALASIQAPCGHPRAPAPRSPGRPARPSQARALPRPLPSRSPSHRLLPCCIVLPSLPDRVHITNLFPGSVSHCPHLGRVRQRGRDPGSVLHAPSPRGQAWPAVSAQGHLCSGCGSASLPLVAAALARAGPEEG